MSDKLSTRIAALEGPCREIDAAILRVHCIAQWEMQDECPRYTSSLDAITQLIEKDFPEGLRGCEQYYLHDDPEQGIGGYEAHCNLRFGEVDRGLGTHSHEAIAYCIAYVKAMEANNETDS